MGRRKRPWGAILRRRLGRPWRSSLAEHPGLITLAVALLLAWGRLRPAVAEIARTQVQNTMTAAIEQAVTEDLAQRNVSYDDFVTIERDSSGAITALSTQTAQMNLLRAELAASILDALEGVDVSAIHLPLGSLLDFEPLWAKDPPPSGRDCDCGPGAQYLSEPPGRGLEQQLRFTNDFI